MRRIAAVLCLAGITGAFGTWGCAPATRHETIGASPSVWTVDYMQTKPGQQSRYLRYLEANWAKSRKKVLAKGGISSYRVLVVTRTEESPWDVILFTEFPDSAAYARAEEVFRPIMNAQGETLIDGLSGKGPDNPLKRTVRSSLAKSAISGR